MHVARTDQMLKRHLNAVAASQEEHEAELAQQRMQHVDKLKRSALSMLADSGKRKLYMGWKRWLEVDHLMLVSLLREEL